MTEIRNSIDRLNCIVPDKTSPVRFLDFKNSESGIAFPLCFVFYVGRYLPRDKWRRSVTISAPRSIFIFAVVRAARMSSIIVLLRFWRRTRLAATRVVRRTLSTRGLCSVQPISIIRWPDGRKKARVKRREELRDRKTASDSSAAFEAAAVRTADYFDVIGAVSWSRPRVVIIVSRREIRFHVIRHVVIITNY